MKSYLFFQVSGGGSTLSKLSPGNNNSDPSSSETTHGSELVDYFQLTASDLFSDNDGGAGGEDARILSTNTDLSMFKSATGKGFNCPFNYCTKFFSRAYDFKRHLMIHTGEKPFACPACSYRANQKSTIKQHFYSKHSWKWDWHCIHDFRYAKFSVRSTSCEWMHRK